MIKKNDPKKKRKAKDEMKEELIKSLIKSWKFESEELNSKVNNVKRYEEAIPVIEQYETISQRQKRNILAIAYRQVCVFKRLRYNNNFLVKMNK